MLEPKGLFQIKLIWSLTVEVLAEKSCSRILCIDFFIFFGSLANHIVHISRDLDLCSIFFYSVPFKSSNSSEVPYLNLPGVPL